MIFFASLIYGDQHLKASLFDGDGGSILKGLAL